MFSFDYFHIPLHFILPFLVAWFFMRSKWKFAFLIMAATILVDLDHLLADPIYSPGRCSIGFHPLHTWWAIGAYVIGIFIPNQVIRLISLGLILHMALDLTDCYI